MKRFLAAALLFAAGAFSAAAADNYQATEGSGKFFGCKDVGGVCYPQWIPVDSTGAAFGVTGNPIFVVFPSAQAVTGPLTDTQLRASPFSVQNTAAVVGQTASGSPLTGNPVRIGISDGTNAQNWLAAIALGDGVNGNNTGAVATWLFNGTTWDRARGDATNGAYVQAKASTSNIGNVGGTSNVTPTDCSGTITSGGTAQNAFTAQSTLRGATIVNLSTDPMWISFTGTAAVDAAGSYLLAAGSTTVQGGSFTTPLGFGFNTALSVIAATTSDKFSCTRW